MFLDKIILGKVYIYIYIFWKFIQYIVYWDKIQIHSFFFRELQLIAVLLLIDNSKNSRSTRFISLKLCVGFSIFDSVSFLLKFILLFNKNTDFFPLKRHNSFQNTSNRKARYSFFLTFKLKQEFWTINDICVSLNSPKPEIETNFLNLKNRRFDYVTFPSY